MFYYAVGKIGSGTDSDPYRPNVPDGTSYSCGLSSDSISFLVGTQSEIPNFTQVVDIQGTCSNFGISYDDVLKWAI